MKKHFLIIGAAILVFIVLLAWLFIESSKPLPGTKINDLGRGHIPVGEKVDYNSNPPTSGKHYEDWVRSGIYNEPKDDRNLVHSLEHGYVILSYNCERKGVGFKGQGIVKTVYAHGIEEEATTSSTVASSSAKLSESFKSEDCHKLVDQLISIYEKKGKTRLIVVPRPNLNTRIALTAWNYIDKFDQFDVARIEKFIEVHINMGPEKTMEK